MQQPNNMKLEKEIFLREQMVSLYMFAAKTIITLSSSTLAFSVGLQGVLDQKDQYELSFLLPVGWVFLVLSLCCTGYAIKAGLDTFYLFYNNLIEGKSEIDEGTGISEKKMASHILNGFVSYIAGVCFILGFIYINFVAQ